MNLLRIRAFLCGSCLAAGTSLLSPMAFADAASDLTAKGRVNVNDQRPELPAVAADSPSGVFGSRGQLTISSDAGLSISSTSTKGIEGSTTKLTLRPALDYFLFNNISVGAFVGLDYTRTGGAHATTFAFGPRLGYDFVFAERFSFWPRLGFSYSHASTKTGAAGSAGSTSVDDVSGGHLALNAFAPLMFHPVQRVFLGFGPALDTDLTGQARQTAVAGRLTLGGWL